MPFRKGIAITCDPQTVINDKKVTDQHAVINTGFYRTGSQLRKLGQYYAKAIESKFGLDFDVLFGPAYKGIPLTVAATMELCIRDSLPTVNL